MPCPGLKAQTPRQRPSTVWLEVDSVKLTETALYNVHIFSLTANVWRSGIGKGRELLDTGDDIASTLINSTLWLEADVLSLTGYAMRTLPTSITDARTSVNGETVTYASYCSLSGPSLVLGKDIDE